MTMSLPLFFFILADLIMLMATSSSQEQQDTGRELVLFINSRRVKVWYSRCAFLVAISDDHADF